MWAWMVYVLAGVDEFRDGMWGVASCYVCLLLSTEIDGDEAHRSELTR